MVHWITDLATRAAMLDGDMQALAALEQIEALQCLHAMDDLDVIRVVCGERCAWCCKYDHGWAVVAVAPLGDIHTTDAVPRAVFYAAPWPAAWRTRWKKGPVSVQSRLEAVGMVVGAWAGLPYPDESCRLAQVAQVDAAGRPLAFYFTPGERAQQLVVRLEQEPGKWFPIPDKWPAGCEAVFLTQTTREKGRHGSYWFLTKRLGQRQKFAGKAARPLTPSQQVVPAVAPLVKPALMGERQYRNKQEAYAEYEAKAAGGMSPPEAETWYFHVCRTQKLVSETS